MRTLLTSLLLALIIATGLPDAGGISIAAPPPDTPYRVYLAQVQRSPHTVSPPPTGGWLDTVNFYRALAALPPVAENAAWSEGDRLHARYIVKNDRLEHDEDPANPWYTPEGQAAARSSNLAASSDPNASDRFMIDLWMQGPFHALGILDPRLKLVGYGSYRESDGGLQSGAGLNVLSGLDWNITASFPVLYPGRGLTAPLRAFEGGEYPNPLSTCPGYKVPSGPPVIVQLGDWQVTPDISASSFKHGEQALEHCLFDETSYTNSDLAQQDLGRAVLDQRGALVLMPRLPLSPGEQYTVSITNAGETITWSFTAAGGN